MTGEEKYSAILKYFQINLLDTDTIHSRTYVSIDFVHDAIIKVNPDMSEPINYYINTAKQLAKNEYRAVNRKIRILAENLEYLIQGEDEFFSLGEYGLSQIELALCMEILDGIPQYKSAVPRRQYKKVLAAIHHKITGVRQSA
jgi:hypothetical protein